MTGLSFDLTEEQEQLRQAVRDFAERECPKDVARRLEAAQDFPEDLARRIAKAGLNGIGIPEEHGGQMSGTKIQKGRLRQRIADELAAGSVTGAPRLSRPATQAESA